MSDRTYQTESERHIYPFVESIMAESGFKFLSEEIKNAYRDKIALDLIKKIGEKAPLELPREKLPELSQMVNRAVSLEEVYIFYKSNIINFENKMNSWFNEYKPDLVRLYQKTVSDIVAGKIDPDEDVDDVGIQIMESYLQNILKQAGFWDGATQEERDEYMDRISEQFMERLGSRMIENLDEEGVVKFSKVSEEGIEDYFEIFQRHVPNFENVYQQVMKEFSSDFLALANKIN